MRTIAFVTQKGGAGKTTLAASLAVAAAGAGERVVALDFDPQGSLARWGQRRGAANPSLRLLVEQFEAGRLPRLGAILERIADTGFTLAVFDTPGANSEAARTVAETADLCLLPARPTHLDIEATAGTFRAIYSSKRRAAFVLNQCPPTPRSARAADAAKYLSELGVLAEPMLCSRIDYQDALAAGLGVTEHDSDGRASQEIIALWRWTKAQFDRPRPEVPAQTADTRNVTGLMARLAGVAKQSSGRVGDLEQRD